MYTRRNILSLVVSIFAAFALLGAMEVSLPATVASQGVTPEGDSPVITFFKVTPTRVKPNRITPITLELGFKDEGANLSGDLAVLRVRRRYSTGQDRYVAIHLEGKVFRQVEGTYKVETSLLCEGWEWVDFSIELRDAVGWESLINPEIRVYAKTKIPEEKQGWKRGKTAYDFTLYDKRGKPVSLSDYKGKVILVNFNGMWCGYCKVEAQHLEELYQMHKDDGLVILSVLYEKTGRSPVFLRDCREWAKTYGLTFPVLADMFGPVYDSYTGRTFKSTRGTPYNVLIDRDGVIRWRAYGFSQARMNAIIRWLDELL